MVCTRCPSLLTENPALHCQGIILLVNLHVYQFNSQMNVNSSRSKQNSPSARIIWVVFDPRDNFFFRKSRFFETFHLKIKQTEQLKIMEPWSWMNGEYSRIFSVFFPSNTWDERGRTKRTHVIRDAMKNQMIHEGLKIMVAALFFI